jgi:amino acid transporter
MSVTHDRQSVAMALAQNRLGAPAILYFVMSAAAPLTVVAGLITTGYAVTGVTGLPLAFLIVAVVLALFSVGYVAMARRVANAGALYSYLAQGLGRPFGVGGAWIALLAYNAMQIGLYGAIGSAAGPLLSEWFGIDAQWYVIALVAWALVAVLGVLRVDVNGMVLAGLLIAEIAVILIFDFTGLAHPAPSGYGLEVFSPGNLFVSGVGALMVIAITGFVGFEGAVVFSEESRDPERTIPAATYGAVGFIAFLYALSAWAMTATVGVDKIASESQQNGPGVVFGVLGQHLGNVMGEIGQVLFATSLLAAMISFHNTTARYIFALGRERVLPAFFGRTGSLNGAPKIGSIAQSALGLAVILVYAFAGLDPLVQLFFYGGTWGGFGVLTLIAATSVAILAFFARDADGETLWRRLIAPGLAVLGMLAVLILALANFSSLLGVPEGDRLAWILPSVYLAAAVLGIGWGLLLRATRPSVYAGVGLGAVSGEGR